MLYDGFHFWGMHLVWWFVWMLFLLWIFATPFEIPGQKQKKNNPLDILQRRFAAGEISAKEYEEMKKILKEDDK